MSERSLDVIHIRDLLLRCVVGVRDWERTDRQNVNLNIDLCADLAGPGRTDRIADTVDYVAVKRKVIEVVENSSFFLIERLAERVAETCLEDPKVRKVRVLVEKPGALRFARSVCVEIVRERPSSPA